MDLLYLLSIVLIVGLISVSMATIQDIKEDTEHLINLVLAIYTNTKKE